MKSLIKYLCMCIALVAIPVTAIAADYDLEAKKAAKNNGCPMKNDEELVCAVIMCDFGALMGEYPSECHQVKLDFAVYLATLGFWDKPPKCFMRNTSCARDGKAKKANADSSICNGNAACVRGVKINNASCDEYVGEEQTACYKMLAKDTGACHELGGADAFECMNGTGTDVIDSSVYTDLHGRLAIKFSGGVVSVVDALPTYFELVRVNDHRMDSLGRSLVLAGLLTRADCPRLGGLLKSHCSEGFPEICWGLSGNYRDPLSDLSRCLDEHYRIK